MIIVKLLGGFSNNLFQYAAGKRLAFFNNDILKLDSEQFKGDLKDIYRLNKLKIKEDIASIDEINELKNLPRRSLLIGLSRKLGIRSSYNKLSHHREHIDKTLFYDSDILNLKGDIYLEGWFQNEIYFKDIRQIILNEFQLKNGLREQNLEYFDLIKETESVSLHIRRGEYIVNPYFGALPLDYYYKAIEYIKLNLSKPEIFVFTDDTDWVSNNFKNIKEYNLVSINSNKASFYHTQYDYEDMYLMKNCKHNIIANSTFSWWSAWLNENPFKIVIAPKKYFNDENYQNNYEKGRFIPKEWIKM